MALSRGKQACPPSGWLDQGTATMTRCATYGVPEDVTVNRGATAFKYCSGRPPRLPKFVDHPELKGRWAYQRLFSEPAEPVSHDPAGDGDLHRFKRMHFCGRRVKTLLERHGVVAVRRSDYERFAQLHQQLREDIASDHLGLVYHLYRQSQIKNVDRDELLSEGMMALTRAIDTFNPWLGFRFSTYACHAIVRAFYRCGLQEARRRRKEPVNFESGIEKSHWLDTRHTDESILYMERLAEILSGCTADLTPSQRDVLAQRFPLSPTASRRTLSDIGQKMNLSKERVRQIEKVALVKLRAALERDPVLNPEPRTVWSSFAGVPPENAVLLDTA